MSCFITDFQILRPIHETPQKRLLEWIEEAHTLAEEEGFRPRVKKFIDKFCCKESSIGNRGHSLIGLERGGWEKKGFRERTDHFLDLGEEIFNRFYPEKSQPAPDDLLHVTCTGYASPSIAQKQVSKLGWGQKTTVTHVYHMGCMAALAAIRIGFGYLAAVPKRVDIVHTEMCSLHMNPSLHAPDQLIAQSLFADGFIKYSLQKACERGFRVMALHEEMIPFSSEMMKWECEDWGLKMTLAKEIPGLIEGHIVAFADALLAKAGISREQALFAIHPGGPKIIDLIGSKLQLTDNQLVATKEVLYRYGNMSSATLPHIFAMILEDERVSTGQYVVGMAFGPGLTMSGIVLEKI